MALVKAHRTHGHLAAHLDPLGSEPVGDPSLDPESLGLSAEVMARVPAGVLRTYVAGDTLAEILPRLRETYGGTIAYEVEHISAHEERVWLREQIESGAHRRPLTAEEQRALLARLTEVEAFERFLHKAYLGQKRFSIEGVDMLVPMLDLTIDLAAEQGANSVVMGMAHRGRLNVLTHTVGKPHEAMLAEFEGSAHRTGEGVDAGTGDVKYHHGAEGRRLAANGHEIDVSLTPNPSHLEFVAPVVAGRVRARQTDRTGREVRHDPSLSLPVVMHGDAAFAGQGVVAETFNLSALPGYRVGGTLHIITNNQIGFTTDMREARSTRYASDLAKGFDVPIIHVNADDPEACLAAVRLSMAYRSKFHRDALIDLVGYRRHGHNEGDEPTYTQPRMYAAIKSLPTARERYARKLADAGVVTAEEAERQAEAAYQRLVEVQQRVKAAAAEPAAQPGNQRSARAAAAVETAVPADRLSALNEEMLAWPDGFTANAKLKRQLERRRGALAEGGVDWGHAEALAFASLLVEGTPIRLTGQDTERGTFSHRHLVLHDANGDAEHVPTRAVTGAAAALEVLNSPLSELATMGFEYGYSADAPETLVLWEAQFGDFVNGAQVIIDQFISAGLSKWGVTSRLTLLLPHGYEGQGPEHSSARLERFLQLAAEGNIRVANCTTPAQYFHLLRRQARLEVQRPLVVMTPKSLLRLPQATSGMPDFAEGRFEPVMDDPRTAPRAGEVSRVVLCSGKVYYDLLTEAEKVGDAAPALVRVEQLYPFPADELRELLGRYAAAKELVWCQEEPRNMGAWRFVEPRLRELAGDRSLRYAGRPDRASPAEGYPQAHAAEQSRIVREAVGSGD
jgi:2-oxoglutarate dehydrogenase E1 component